MPGVLQLTMSRIIDHQKGSTCPIVRAVDFPRKSPRAVADEDDMSLSETPPRTPILGLQVVSWRTIVKSVDLCRMSAACCGVAMAITASGAGCIDDRESGDGDGQGQIASAIVFAP